MPRTFAVGDVHGHLSMLREVLLQVEATAAPGDTLLFVGDYIDRGPESKGVVDEVLRLRERWDGPLVFLLGNHEDMLLDQHRRAQGERPVYDPLCWELNGGTACRRSYGEEGIPEDHWAFFLGLRLRYEDEHAHYVHAGFRPGQAPEECSRTACLMIGEEFLGSAYCWDKPVVFGHTPQQPRGRGSGYFAPRNEPSRIGIDTGSCFGGYLTAVQLPERIFYTSY